MTERGDKQFWYNMRTGAVEFGYASPSLDRVGPFPTQEAAAHALEKLRENSEKWDDEDARDAR
ncbi:methionine aminopeptidase [Microterricola viridarii]|uniref:Methionine aminopeptidase n=1 Tax=Microterricola viridarii TaxID=412690 RepID=A0A0X8E2L5_9MICO|nr:methionine aminopeptidase [Microterricola viridarii]AMB58567.1 methionine aminopeptidase [Microterricola viridarii]